MRKGSWRSWAGVKSLVHCRCPAAHSATFAPGRHLHLHVKGPCLSTLYVSLPQEPFVALLSFIISPLSSHFFLSSHQLWVCLSQEEERRVGRGEDLGAGMVEYKEEGEWREGVGAPHIEFAKSGRTMDRKPGRKEDETLPREAPLFMWRDLKQPEVAVGWWRWAPRLLTHFSEQHTAWKKCKTGFLYLKLRDTPESSTVVGGLWVHSVLQQRVSWKSQQFTFWPK